MSATLSQFWTNERGNILIPAALASTVMVASAGLAIDFGYFHMTLKELQVSADSSALAASAMLPDETVAEQMALDYAGQNMIVASHGNVLADTDIQFGIWDEATRTLLPAAGDANAVQVTTRRAEVNGNPVSFAFGQIIGYLERDLSATAIAMHMPADCFQAGGTAGGKVIFGQDAGLSGFCMYGREGVTFGQDAVIENDAQIGALDLDKIIFGQGAIYPDDALITLDKEPSRSFGLEDYINDLESGAVTIPGMPNVVAVAGSDVPDILVEGTVYIINSSVNLNKYSSATNVLIAVRGNIQFGQDANLVNTGDVDTGDASIGVIATGDVKFVHDGVVSGVDVIAGKDIVIGQNVGGISATFTAGDNIHIGQNAKLDFNPFDPAVYNAPPTQASVLVQ